MYKLGIDLGGTKIEGVVLDDENREIFRQRIPTEQHLGYGHILDNIQRLYRVLLQKIGNEKHRFGIGTPGSISKDSGLMRNSNTIALNGKPLKHDLQEKLGREIELQNDANCFALAEAVSGAGKGYKMVFGVIMGTGCGGGIIYNGEIWRGLQDIGGEWGHMTINPSGPLCYCGSRGCVETYISGGGLQRLYHQQYGETPTFVEITEKYYAGNKDAVAFMNQFFDNYGRAMANLINILDPSAVVLGGGLSNFEELYTRGTDAVKKYIFSDGFKTPILKNKLGDSAGVIGAALMGI
jgi:fructokinase